MWADRLRDPELVQASGALGRVDYEGNQSYCCLGVACEFLVPSVHKVVDNGWSVEYDGESGLAPYTLLDWLFGEDFWDRPEDVEDGGCEFDIPIDWPEDLEVRDGAGSDLTRRAKSDNDINTAAGLNDSGEFTFSQIADIIDYFGVRNSI